MPCSFRGFVPPPRQHPRLGDINFSDFDADSWAQWGMNQSFVKELWEGWQKLYKEQDQMVISPVFFGCEPNQIDGEHAGTEVFALEMQLAVRLMQSLSDDNRKKAIVYGQLEHPDMPDGFPHPADGRNLTGAYEDNRVIPCSGVRVPEFSDASTDIFLQLIETFIDFIPNGSLDAKMGDIKAHLDDTWLMWMGNYADEDPFHFRINSPVRICEFDHECGMYLSNSVPGRFHVHSVVRTPNGNDYGKEILRLWKEKNRPH